MSLLATLGTIVALIAFFLLQGPRMRQGLLDLLSPERAAYGTRVVCGTLPASITAGIVTATAFSATSRSKTRC